MYVKLMHENGYSRIENLTVDNLKLEATTFCRFSVLQHRVTYVRMALLFFVLARCASTLSR